MASVHALSESEEKAIKVIFEKLPKEAVYKKAEKILEEMMEFVSANFKDWMYGEYILEFEQIVVERSKQLIIALLRGEILEDFGLKLKERWNSNELWAYDQYKTREAIVRDFAPEIQTAEIVELRKRVAELEEQLKWERMRNH